jgi:hypothetical protein
MTIVEAMKSDVVDLRISHHDRWLVWNTTDKLWYVYEHKPYQKRTKVIIYTASEELAVASLLQE